MSSTRYHYDTVRTKKQLQEMTGPGNYQLGAPGPNIETPFIEDPQIRLQGWGANLQKNTADLESDLFGLNRRLTHGSVEYQKTAPKSSLISYPDYKTDFVDESRAINPAWLLRDLEQRPKISWENISSYNYKGKVEIPFENNVNSRER